MTRLVPRQGTRRQAFGLGQLHFMKPTGSDLGDHEVLIAAVVGHLRLGRVAAERLDQLLDVHRSRPGSTATMYRAPIRKAWGSSTTRVMLTTLGWPSGVDRATS